jgi:Calcineurin-like phosphoesterase
MVGRAARVSPFWTYISKILLLFLAWAVFSTPAGRTADAPQVVIAIGDVHGDFDDFCMILKRVGLIDEKLHWAGGHATLVQTGDLLDRGLKERQALDLMMSLEEEAAKAGGQVVALLGNHEMMNLMGDLRYVTPELYASFSTPDSDARRRTGWWLPWRRFRATSGCWTMWTNRGAPPLHKFPLVLRQRRYGVCADHSGNFRLSKTAERNRL